MESNKNACYRDVPIVAAYKGLPICLFFFVLVCLSFTYKQPENIAAGDTHQRSVVSYTGVFNALDPRQ